MRTIRGIVGADAFVAGTIHAVMDLNCAGET